MADGHLTKEPDETVYSGVVSLRNLRLAMFLAELMIFDCGDEMLEMYLSKHSQKKSSTLWLNMLLLEKSGQMGNNLAEQQVNNNKAITKWQVQEQLSSPLSQVQKTYAFGKYENCEPNTDINWIYPLLHPTLYHMCRTPHRRPPSSCRNMYLALLNSP